MTYKIQVYVFYMILIRSYELVACGQIWPDDFFLNPHDFLKYLNQNTSKSIVLIQEHVSESSLLKLRLLGSTPSLWFSWSWLGSDNLNFYLVPDAFLVWGQTLRTTFCGFYGFPKPHHQTPLYFIWPILLILVTCLAFEFESWVSVFQVKILLQPDSGRWLYYSLCFTYNTWFSYNITTKCSVNGVSNTQVLIFHYGYYWQLIIHEITTTFSPMHIDLPDIS